MDGRGRRKEGVAGLSGQGGMEGRGTAGVHGMMVTARRSVSVGAFFAVPMVRGRRKWLVVQCSDKCIWEGFGRGREGLLVRGREGSVGKQTHTDKFAVSGKG